MTETKPKVNPTEYAVLEVLAEEWNSDRNCFYFKGIVSRLKGLKNELDLKPEPH